MKRKMAPPTTIPMMAGTGNLKHAFPSVFSAAQSRFRMVERLDAMISIDSSLGGRVEYVMIYNGLGR